VTPPAFQRAAFEKYCRADAGAVVDRIFTDVENCTGKHPVHCTNNLQGSQECEEKDEISL
jgi:hypothetical protein